MSVSNAVRELKMEKVNALLQKNNIIMNEQAQQRLRDYEFTSNTSVDDWGDKGINISDIGRGLSIYANGTSCLSFDIFGGF